MAYSGGLHTPESEIFLIRPDGSEELQLTNNDCGDGYPQWSFDGQHLFYWSFCQEGEFLLEGTTELNVIEIATMHQWGALRYTLPFESWADLAITDAQTMEPLALEFPEEPQTVSLIEVYWTPDLSHFVVVTCEGDTEFGCFGTRLYWVDVGDATVRLIEPDNADPTVEAVFPDGSRLLLRTRDEGRGFWHYTLDMETGETELLTRELGLGWDFAFSPDGMMLSYIRQLDRGSYVFDLSSGELTRLPEPLFDDPDSLSWLPRTSYGPGACTQESAGP